MASPSYSDAVIDGGPDYLVANCTRVTVCSADPNGVWSAIAGVTLAEYTISGPDWSKLNGDVSGRKVQLAAQTGNNGSADGAANFIVYHDGTSEWMATLDGNGESVNNGSPANIAAHDVMEARDPTNP